MELPLHIRQYFEGEDKHQHKCIWPGVWSTSFGWELSAEGKLGDGQDYYRMQ